MRRNIDFTILLFNNQIYGLTKVNILQRVKLVKSPNQLQWVQ